MAANPTPTSAQANWAQGDQSDKVQLPDGHALHLTASGPARQSPGTPAVIIEHGLGGSASEWVAVQRLVARFARVYVYERAGYHPSDPPTKDPTAQNIAADLRMLLRTAGVEPPYLLVGHSYGGVLIRQYLADYTDEVFGMLIVDSAPIVTKVPPSWSTLVGDSSYEEIVGIKASHVLTDQEYQTMQRDGDMNSGIATKELDVQPEGAKALKHRLESRRGLLTGRLSIIFCDESIDFGKVYEYGVQHGNGTEEAREALRKRLEDMSEVDEAAMREHLALSHESRFVKAEGKQRTHNVHVVDPAFVTREIQWVFEGRRSA